MEAYGYLEDEAVDLVGYGGRNMRYHREKIANIIDTQPNPVDYRDLVLFSFLVCDGDPTRARRTIMFDHRWKMMVTAPSSCLKYYKVLIQFIGCGGSASQFSLGHNGSCQFCNQLCSSVRLYEAEPHLYQPCKSRS